MQPGSRVYGFSINSHLKVEVRSGRRSGRADRADRLAAFDGLAVRYVNRAEVAVAGRVAAPMIDQNVVTVAAVPLRHDNASTRGRRYGRAARRGDIEPLMEFRRASERVRAPPEGRGDRPSHRPGKGARSAGSFLTAAAGDPGGGGQETAG